MQEDSWAPPTSAVLSTQITLDRFLVVGGSRLEYSPCVAAVLEHSAVTRLAWMTVSVC